MDELIEVLEEHDEVQFLVSLDYNQDESELYSYLEKNSEIHNIEVTNLIKYFIEYLIKNKEEIITDKCLTLFTFIIHNITINKEFIIYFFIRKFCELNKL